MRPELVVEVRYDKVQGNRFRHGTKFIRWRDDKDPARLHVARGATPARAGRGRDRITPRLARARAARSAGRSEGGLRHMPRIGSPTASIRAAHRLQRERLRLERRRPRPSGAARRRARRRSAGPSRPTRSSGRARSGRSRRRRRSGRRRATSSSPRAGRRSAARPPPRAPSRSAARPGSERRGLIGARMCRPVDARRLRIRAEPELVQHLAHDERDLADERPLPVGRRVEVDQEVVGLLDLGHARVPRVQLDAAEVRDPGERGGVVDDREHGRVAARERDEDLVDVVRVVRRHALLVEEVGVDAVREPLHVERPPAQVGEGELRDRRRSRRRGRPSSGSCAGKKSLSGFETGTSTRPTRIQRVS